MQQTKLKPLVQNIEIIEPTIPLEQREDVVVHNFASLRTADLEEISPTSDIVEKIEEVFEKESPGLMTLVKAAIAKGKVDTRSLYDQFEPGGLYDYERTG